MSMFGDSWRGGSARAAVRGYVTRQGKKVKAHTRKVVKCQSRAAGNALLGSAAFKVVTGLGSWQSKVVSLLGVALGLAPQKKARGRR